jgi:hypothetical protein
MSSIALTTEGFTLPDGEIAWANVAEIVAWKHDDLTTDLLCFDVTNVTTGTVVTLTEDFDGFWEFAKACEARLPGFKNGWQETVLKPAFAESRQVLFKRKH